MRTLYDVYVIKNVVGTVINAGKVPNGNQIPANATRVQTSVSEDEANYQVSTYVITSRC